MFQKLITRKTRAILGVLFVLSTCLALGFVILAIQFPEQFLYHEIIPTPRPTSLPGYTPVPVPQPVPPEQEPNLVVVGSLVATILTSLTTFLGFITTTVLAWRKESRESKSAELERQRQKLELEKQQFELEKVLSQLGAAGAGPQPQEKKTRKSNKSDGPKKPKGNTRSTRQKEPKETEEPKKPDAKYSISPPPDSAERVMRAHLTRVMNKLTAPERELCSCFFDRLVTPTGALVAQSADDLVVFAASSIERVIAIIEQLVDSHILRALPQTTEQSQTKSYEIFHSILAPPILDWRRQYLERKRIRRLRLIALGTAVAIVVFSAPTIVAIGAITRANTTEAQVNANRLALESASLGDQNRDLALLLDVEALHLDNNPYVQSNLRNALLSKSRIAGFLRSKDNATDVRSVAFSPDGKILASGGFGLTFWDVNTRRPIGERNIQSGGPDIPSMAFSPDSKILATSGIYGSITLWDVSTHQTIGDSLKGHSDWVSSVAFSPDGTTLASGSFDGNVILWEVGTRQPIRDPLKGHKSSVETVAFSPDGKTLASGSDDTSIILWDVSTHQRIGDPLKGHTSAVTSVAFNPDGKNLASGSCVYADSSNICTQGEVILWDLVTHQPIGDSLRGHTNWVLGVAFSPDGKMLASGSLDSTITLWEVSTHRRMGDPLQGHKDKVWSLAYSPDGKTLASSSGDGNVILWDASMPDRSGPPVIGHVSALSSVAYSPDGKILASGGCRKIDSFSCILGDITLWDVSTHQRIGNPFIGHQGSVASVAFSSNGKTLVSVGQDGIIFFWNLSTHSAAGNSLEGYDTYKNSLKEARFSPDNKTLAWSSPAGPIYLWDVNTQKAIGHRLEGQTEVTSVAFSPDGKTLASGSLDKTIILWDVSAQKPIGDPLKGHINFVHSVAFSPDGKTLASGSCGNPESNNVCTQGEIILWDVSTHQRIGDPLKGHAGWIGSVAFSPDGKTLASGSSDGTTILWNVSRHQPVFLPLMGDGSIVEIVAFSPDSNTLVSASSDHNIILWDADTDLESLKARACRIANRNLTQKEWNLYMNSSPIKYKDYAKNPTCPIRSD